MRWASPVTGTPSPPTLITARTAVADVGLAVTAAGDALVAVLDAEGGIWLEARVGAGTAHPLASRESGPADVASISLASSDDGTFELVFDAGGGGLRARTVVIHSACGPAEDETKLPAQKAPDADAVDADGDGFALDTDCDETEASVHPGAAELCNAVDDDCDGEVDEDRGDRFVAAGGSDAVNTCTVPEAPCATIGRAIRAACAGETVRVAEGDYTEDVVVDRRLSIVSQGVSLRTVLRGSGATDAVKILSGGVHWNGITVADTPGHACLRVGDAQHAGVRGVTISNAAIERCGAGIVFENTDAPGAVEWNRVLSVDLNGARGGEGGGAGLYFTGGNARTEVKVSRIHDNAGPGIAIDPPAPERTNRSIVLAGVALFATEPPGGPMPPALVARSVSDLRLEGNEIAGVQAPDGAAVLDEVTGGRLACNRFRANTAGLVLSGGTAALEIAQNRFLDHTGVAVRVGADAGAGTVLSENTFSGNGAAIENLGTATVAARHNWWGAPGGPAPFGDPLVGTVDASEPIASSSAPILVRRPADSGWDSSPATCFHELQPAIDSAAPKSLLLVGPGVYRGGVSIERAVEIRGVDGGSACSPSEIDGAQQDGLHRPAVHVFGTQDVVLSNLTIRDAGKGSTPCGSSSGDEVGLALDDVRSSTFRRLCLQSNGVSEVRVRGNADGNLFDRLTIDGMWRAQSGADACGHRSRDGVLFDGWPACQGGQGASADGNILRDSRIDNVARGVTARLATLTVISGNTLRTSRAAAWDGGAYSAGIVVESADATIIESNTLGAARAGELTDGIRVGGRSPDSCHAAPRDSRDTRITRNTITGAAGAAIRSWRPAGSGGDALHTVATCNALRDNAIGIRSESAGAEAGAMVAHFNDIRGNAVGVRNVAFDVLDVRSNWWGSASGPSGSAPGTGDAVQGSVIFGPWLLSAARSDDDGDALTECDGDCDDHVAGVGAGPPESCGGGLDEDCDGATDGDDTDCAVLEVRHLEFQDAGRLAWDTPPAGPFAVLRGTIPGGGFAGFDHRCVASGVPANTLAVGAVPAAGTADYYLVAAQSAGTPLRPGPLGRGSAGTWRPMPASGCP